MSGILHPPEPWSDLCRTITLWHGCCHQDAKSIQASGVDPARGKPDTDFGRGFYTTTFRLQAEKWAWQRRPFLPPDMVRGKAPVVLRFRVPLEEIARLDTLHFVSDVSDRQPFWSLVHHCRQGGLGHLHPGRTAPNDWYDVVSGPVAGSWKQCIVFKDADQYSFHTAIAVEILNRLIDSGDKDRFQLFRVRKRR